MTARITATTPRSGTSRKTMTRKITRQATRQVIKAEHQIIGKKTGARMAHEVFAECGLVVALALSGNDTAPCGYADFSRAVRYYLAFSAVSAALKCFICSLNCASTSSAMVTMLGRSVLNSKFLTLLCSVVKMLTCSRRDSSINISTG